MREDDPHVPSVTDLFPTANWHERETFDFYGLVFDGHPDLTRIVLPADWDGIPAAQGRAARRRAHLVPRGEDAADRRAGHGVSTSRHDLPGAAYDAAGDVTEAFRDPATGDFRQETMIINMGPAAPLDPRGAPPAARARRRDGHPVQAGDRLPAHRHREEHRVPHLGAGRTYVTRADYVAPFFNELAYCLAVERLLGVEVPERAQIIRVLVCELNRITSHLVGLATGGLELGAVSVMLYGLRERELIMDIFEAITGLRMNHAYIRPGGVVMDLQEESPREIRDAHRPAAEADRRVRDAAERQPDLARAQRGCRGALGGALPGARRDRPAAAAAGIALRPPQGHALLRLRDLRLRRADAHRGRRLRALPRADRRDAGVAEDRRAERSSGCLRRPAR